MGEKLTQHRNNLTAIKWRDVKELYILSTAHSNHITGAVSPGKPLENQTYCSGKVALYLIKYHIMKTYPLLN